MKKDTSELKKIAREILDTSSEPRKSQISPIVKNTKSFGLGVCIGFFLCLGLLPILGYYPTMKDSVISAIVSGIITLIFTNYTTKK